ncbi:hypothetical protein [Gulosibacter molinativorax]|uniref:Uncharacterized protein n=1 Tax=Gulosibacter molinativorax TaxID=256821 RepID=A0ABT7C6F1_9MICO|nr:hypothetical protein [Gulosibacter molinativorax]MDJ1370760.1 hypothetical protein [Gulosibacter molinativorax]
MGAGQDLGLGFQVEPWVVAHHDEKTTFHEGAGDELLNLDVTAGLASLDEFQAVGYHHFETTDLTLHMEYETSVSGESYVSRLFTDMDGYSFDQSHEEGSGETFYLLGDKIKEEIADGKTWVSMPVPDLGLKIDPAASCQLFAVAYTCALVDAWNLTRDNLESVPVQLSRSESGDQHFATAVTYGSLSDTGLITGEGNVQGFDGKAMRDTLIPMHLWVNPDGIVTKIEVNGVLKDESGRELSLQIGFELTSTSASADMVPVAAGDIPQDDLYRITTTAQLEEFLQKIGSV